MTRVIKSLIRHLGFLSGPSGKTNSSLPRGNLVFLGDRINYLGIRLRQNVLELVLKIDRSDSVARTVHTYKNTWKKNKNILIPKNVSIPFDGGPMRDRKFCL